MTPAERVVVEAAVRWARGHTTDSPLAAAVDALLAERAGPQLETVGITWAQVVEGDQIFRAANGSPCPPDDAAGKWFEVIRSGPLGGTDRMRINARGIPKPIQPVAKNPVTVKRGATGKAIDNLGSVLWSGAVQHEIRDVAAAIISDPVTSEGEES